MITVEFPSSKTTAHCNSNSEPTIPLLKDDGLIMVERKPHRVIRELTTHEREILNAARADAEAEKESILEQAREAKSAWQETRRVVDVLIAELKAERERQALSLADVEERTGIRRSVLSRLENDATSNPTMLTLQRYAVALGLNLRAELTITHQIHSLENL